MCQVNREKPNEFKDKSRELKIHFIENEKMYFCRKKVEKFMEGIVFWACVTGGTFYW